MNYKINKFRKIFRLKNILKILSVVLYVVVAKLIWHYCKDNIFINILTIPPITLGDKILFYVYNGGLLIFLIIMLIVLIFALTRVYIKKEKKGMKDIGLKNKSDETL